jgi:Spy/CpxP family protein refolding chaperone
MTLSGQSHLDRRNSVLGVNTNTNTNTNTEKDDIITHRFSESHGAPMEQTKVNKSMKQKLEHWYQTQRQAMKRFVKAPL